MAGPTKAELREQLDELELDPLPASATRDELLAAVAAAGVEIPQSPAARSTTRAKVTAAARGVGGRRKARCAGGRPLLADDVDVCRQCYVAGETVCPESDG